MSFDDDAGNDESLTSAPTEVVTVLIWSATLTAGTDGTQSGYSLSDETGTLSPNVFSVGVADYLVSLLLYNNDGALILGLDRELPAPFTLGVGTVGLASEEASASTSEDGSAYTYRWDIGTGDWSVGEEVQLTLTMPYLPLTAVIEAAAASHDGQSEFTFELRFSEEPDSDFSYVTLRDHTFTVTGGTVINVRRLDPPGNVHWEIAVEPDSNDDVTVVLPPTTGCDDQGAICTEDGRKLSNRLEFTVSGPGE